MDAEIAILMTCHNRCALTRRCLETLARQPLFRPENLFLVDDGSSDGTGDMVRAMFPDAQVIVGSGDLFWNGGMRLAWDRAHKALKAFDHYLWLNDDVVLREGVLKRLVTDADAVAPGGTPVIVAGSTVEPGTVNITYGAHRRSSPRRPLRLAMVEPNGSPQRVDTISGNVVLVSNAAERILGNMNPAFEHIYGDLDYGFRAHAAGVPIFLASDVAGECEGAAVKGGSLEPGIGCMTRLRRKLVEERKVHARDWRRMVRMHSGLGPFSFLYSLTPYVRAVLRR